MDKYYKEIEGEKVFFNGILIMGDRHKIVINAMTNIEDIETFDITADCPERLEFSI